MKNGPLKRGRVMQIYARDHIEVHTEKKKEVLYLVKNKTKTKTKKLGRNRRVEGSAVRIRCRLLMLPSKMYVYSITKKRLEIYFEFS